jgi:uncharacterized protein YabE (DUF348 family)
MLVQEKSIKKVNILVTNTYNKNQEVDWMFEYGKDIPLEGAVLNQVNQQGAVEEQLKAEGTVFSFDHRKDIPLDGVNK